MLPVGGPPPPPPPPRAPPRARSDGDGRGPQIGDDEAVAELDISEGRHQEARRGEMLSQRSRKLVLATAARYFTVKTSPAALPPNKEYIVGALFWFGP